MIKIAFCDDEPVFLEQITGLLERYKAQRCPDMEYTAFHSPLELLAEMENGLHPDVLLLDAGRLSAVCPAACPHHVQMIRNLLRLMAEKNVGLARKVETQVDESWYEAFYHHLRMEMDEYRRLKRSLRVLKSYTDYEEDLYEEAV